MILSFLTFISCLIILSIVLFFLYVSFEVFTEKEISKSMQLTIIILTLSIAYIGNRSIKEHNQKNKTMEVCNEK